MNQKINVKGTFLTMQAFSQNYSRDGTVLSLISLATAGRCWQDMSSYASSNLTANKLRQAIGPGILAGRQLRMRQAVILLTNLLSCILQLILKTFILREVFFFSCSIFHSPK